MVAVEFIRRLRLRYPNLKPENILYVCERPAMLPQIRYVSFKFQGEGLDHVASLHLASPCRDGREYDDNCPSVN